MDGVGVDDGVLDCTVKVTSVVKPVLEWVPFTETSLVDKCTPEDSVTDRDVPFHSLALRICCCFARHRQWCGAVHSGYLRTVGSHPLWGKR